MSHRRKSARPTNKLNRRTATDSSSVSSDSDADHGKMFADHCRAGLLVDGESLGASASPSQLEIPPDLWQDFEALLAATNLDAASLMRRLIQQYGRNSAPVDCDLPGDVTDDCGEDACPDDSVEDLTYPPPSPSSADEVLDLSSSGINRKSRTSPSQQSMNSFLHSPNDDNTDVDKPLDLTLAKVRARSPELSVVGEGRKDHVTRVLDAHNFPSDIVALLTSSSAELSRPGPFLPSPVTSSHPPTLRSSPAHMPTRSPPAHSSTRPTPSHAASHLFAHTIVCSPKYGRDEMKSTSDGLPSAKYPPATDFGSASNHLTPQMTHGATAIGQVTKQGGAAHGDLHPPRGHALLPMALHLLSSVPTCSSPRHEGCTPRTCTTTSSSGSMQLPTVTSMDFQLDPGRLNPAMTTGCSNISNRNNNNSSFGSLVAVQQPEAQHSTAPAPITLPASAVYLDTANSGLVASATASQGVCVTTVSIPFVTAAAGEGMVAIPLLQAPRPEMHPIPNLPQPAAASATTAHSGQPLTFAPSAAPPTSSPSRSLKPKLGRPRGPYAKPQKVAPKDMKLVTENSLFPGVYTSILKLPWSKRSRGKSAKIKDAEAAAAAAAATASPTTSTSTPMPAVAPQDAQVSASPSSVLASIASSPSRDAAPISMTYLSMPVIVPEHAQSVSTPEHAQSQHQQQPMAAHSVMMVYPNAAMTSMGKPGRRRGRPPKLPVLSHLLTEKKSKKEDPSHKTQCLPQEGEISSQDCTSQRQPPASTMASCLSYTSAALAPDDDGASENDDRRERGAASKKYVSSTSVSSGNNSTSTGGGEQRPEEASLETRFNILANQLGLEIGSAYHANLVYATPSARQAVDSALYKEMLMSSRSLVEVKPRRRQLNDLIKPTDDVVFTSFRIRPRGSGRGGTKAKRIRKCRRRGEYGFDGGSDSLDLPGVDGVADYVTPDGYGNSNSSKSSSAPMLVASAVITEPVPGAGNMMQRLYQDLYRCQQCDEILPADDTVEHACSSSRASPAGRKCDRCGAALPAGHRVEEVGEVTLCDKCLPDSRTLPEMLAPKCALPASSSPCFSPPPVPAAVQEQHGVSRTQSSLADAFSCQPCNMQFVTIAEYIDHRRRAHLDKLCRQTRKTHSLKTLACPVHTCPRLFHTQAELTRHVQDEHDSDAVPDLELKDKESRGSGGGAPALEVKDKADLTLAPVDDLLLQAAAGASEGYHSRISSTTAPAPPAGQEFLPQAAASDEEGAVCFSCTQEGCHESYDSALDVLEHVQAAHQDVRRWQCPWAGCVRQFGAERHLRVHLLIHKDEKPLKCDLCDYRCRQRNALNWHMRKHPEAAVHYRKFSNVTSDI